MQTGWSALSNKMPLLSLHHCTARSESTCMVRREVNRAGNTRMNSSITDMHDADNTNIMGRYVVMVFATVSQD
jgi:hypothetical protein